MGAKNLLWPALLCVSFLTVGCATSSAKLDGFALARDIEKAQGTVSPKGETSSFTSHDRQAVMWVKLGELSGSQTLRWEWYDPEGNLYLASDDFEINKSGDYRHYAISWHKIALKGEKAGNMQGRWLAKILLNGNVIATKDFEVVKTPSITDIQPGLKASAPDPSKWALVVGVERYRKAPPVQFAVNDASAMEEYFTDYLGVPKANSISLLNESATKAEIELLVKDRLRGLMKPGDTLYVYYSGHGIPADESPYLLPFDGDPESPAITAYPVERLYVDLAGLPAGKVYVFLDTCFSGRSGRADKEGALYEGARPGILKVKDPLLLSEKLTVFSAAKASQLSNSYKEKGLGLFTYYLLKGMAGYADRNGDGKIQTGELSRYLEDEVGTGSRMLFGIARQQTPVVAPEAGKGNAEIADTPAR